jgi:hypothetical protein
VLRILNDRHVTIDEYRVRPAMLAQLIELPTARVEALCDELAAQYDRDGRGFTLARVAGGQPSRTLWAVLVVTVLAYGLARARRAALAGDETTGLTLTGFVGGLVSPVTWSHHLFWFVPALVVLVDVAATRGAPGRGRAGVLAAVVYATVVVSLISWYEWHLAPRTWDHGVPGFMIDNWYVLLILILLAALPIRAPDADPVAKPTSRQDVAVS